MKKYLILVIIILVSLVVGCNSTDAKLYTSSYNDYFATFTTFNIKANKINEETIEEGIEAILKRLDEKFNVQERYNSIETEVMKINNNAPNYVTVSDEVIFIINQAIEISKETALDGKALFDITIQPLNEAWDFNNNYYDWTLDNRHNPPSQQEIDESKALVNYQNIEIKGNEVRLKEGMKIDLGSIVKGYAASEIEKYLRTQNITDAVINVGGNIVVMGSCYEGGAWTDVKIQTPFVRIIDEDYNEIRYIGEIEVEDKTIVTSGIYQRYITSDEGLMYHHILNPETGYPIDNGVIAVCIITTNSLLADAYSTALFTMGLEKGMMFVEEKDDFEAIYIITNGDKKEIHLSSGLLNNFKFNKSVEKLGYELK